MLVGIILSCSISQPLELTDKIYIAGHRGMVGSALFRNLQAKGYTNIITRTSAELDLREQAEVNEFFQKEKPLYVFSCCCKGWWY
jgi:GDP-L-fucose synthase